MKIAISGASGFVGSQLLPALRAVGHTVQGLPHIPGTFQLDLSGLLGAEAVIHLAGENLAEGRWTAAKKEGIRRSRIDTTRQLATALRGLPTPPRVWVCASAVGYYGNRGDEVLTEESTKGNGFLADLVRDWEAACKPARDAGIRVVNTRFGVILSPDGGVLAKMLPLFKMGLGGPVGSGEQWLSWVALPDVIAALQFLLTAEAIRGPVNVMSPHPMRNRDFAHTLGHALHRPSLLAVPAVALKVLLGEMAEETVLASQRAFPKVLQKHGYALRHTELDATLNSFFQSRSR